MQTLKSQSGLPASASRIRSSSLSVPVITSLLCARFLPSHLSSVRHPCLSLPNTSHWFTATSCQCYCKSFLVALINPLTYPSRNYLRHFSEMNLALVSLLSKYSQRMTRDSIFLKNKYNYFCLSFSFKHLMIPPPPSSNLKSTCLIPFQMHLQLQTAPVSCSQLWVQRVHGVSTVRTCQVTSSQGLHMADRVLFNILSGSRAKVTKCYIYLDGINSWIEELRGDWKHNESTLHVDKQELQLECSRCQMSDRIDFLLDAIIVVRLGVNIGPKPQQKPWANQDYLPSVTHRAILAYDTMYAVPFLHLLLSTQISTSFW